jgi:hypothetical protein
VLETPEKIRELQRKLYRKAKQVLKGESLRMKIIGKPYSGKPNVRFDEGELEIEPSATTPALDSTGVLNPLFEDSFLNSAGDILAKDT